MNKVFIISLFFLLSINTIAQNLEYGSIFHLQSEILSEEREIWVSLPANYNDTIYAPASYPVMYLLDPNFYFQSMVAVRDALTGSHYSYMPEMIIIGIVNTDRSRDLMPTNSFIIHSGKKIHKSSGGANEFTHFIIKELMPYIDSTYRTNGYKLLNGHSFGGLYALNLLIEQPGAFNAYIAHDPSLWWDNKIVYKKALDKLADQDLSGITLFLSKANNDTTEEDRFAHSSTIDSFHKNVLKDFPENGLRYKFSFFEEEDHGTIFLPATYTAMKYIYNDYCLPVKKAPLYPDIIEKQANAVSDNIGRKLIYEEHILDNIGKYCMAVGELSGALKIFERNRKYYPQSANTCISLANLYARQNNWPKTLEYYNRAISLNPAYEARYKQMLDSFRKKLEK